MSNIIIFGILFFVTKILATIWPEISPHHHPQWPEFVSPAFRGWPPKGLKILPDGVPSAFPTFLERDEAAVHQTELGSLQEAGLVLA